MIGDLSGLGVDIHFTAPEPGELERFRESGLGWVRIDCSWSEIETRRGTYDFSRYDHLVAFLESTGARAILILDYGNTLYQDGAPRSDSAQAAFARFAAAAVLHFRGKPVVWELWNEPNLSDFWQPVASADEYTALLKRAVAAMRAAHPSCTIIAPGVSGFPWEFLEQVFRSGVLAELDGVSIHPYRSQAPESVGSDYARLRALIARFAPPHKANLPLICSEWGYSTVTVSEAIQAAYLTRVWLVNRALGVPLTLLYDWRDDGDDPANAEHRFGIVRRNLVPKPAFLALQRLQKTLVGYRFRHRLRGANPDEWRLLFQKGETVQLALLTWNARQASALPQVRQVTPKDPGWTLLERLARIRIAPGVLVESAAQRSVLPVQIVGKRAKDYVQLELEPVEGGPRVGFNLAAENHLPLPVVPRRSEKRALIPHLVWNNQPLPLLAPLTLMRTDPLPLTVQPRGSALQAMIENPTGAALEASLIALQNKQRLTERVRCAEGERQVMVPLALDPSGGLTTVRLVDPKGQLLAETPPVRFAPLSQFPLGWQTVHYDENRAQPPRPLGSVAFDPPDAPGADGLQVALSFPHGWQYTTITPSAPLQIPGYVRAVTLWVWGEPSLSGDALRCRLKDASGQVLQVDLGSVPTRAWSPVTIPFDGSGVGSFWGGRNDGTPHAPLTFDALLLIDSASRTAHQGTLRIAAPAYLLR